MAGALPRRAALSALASLVGGGAAGAAESVVQLADAEAGDRITLIDGRRLVPLGMVIPQAGREGDAAATFASAARDLVRRLAAPGVTLTGAETDRWGALHARVRIAGAGPLDEAVLRAGLAWAWPEQLPAEAARRLLGLEQEARVAALGLWSVPSLAELSADLTPPVAPRFAVLRARVQATGSGGDQIYLNFGADRRSDLTVRTARRDEARFRRAGVDLPSLAGREVRVRGWLFAQDGAMIEAAEPFQIEVLGS